MIDTIDNDLSALTYSGDEAEYIPSRPFTAPVKSQRKDLNNLQTRPITSQGRRASTSFIPVERPKTAIPSDRLKFMEKQSSENSLFSSSKMSNAARSSYRPSSAGRSNTFIEYRRQQHEKMMERKNSQSSNLSSNDGSFRDSANDERDDVERKINSANSSTGSLRREQMQTDREIKRSILRQEMKIKREEMMKRTEYCRNSLKDLRDQLDEVNLNHHSIKKPIGILKNKMQDTTMTPAKNKGEEVTLVAIKRLKGRLSELQTEEQQEKACIAEEKERVKREDEQEKVKERTNLVEEEKVISKPIKEQKRVQINISSYVEESEDYGSTYNSEEQDSRSYYSDDDASYDESTMYGDTFDDANIGKSQCSWKVW